MQTIIAEGLKWSAETCCRAGQGPTPAGPLNVQTVSATEEPFALYQLIFAFLLAAGLVLQSVSAPFITPMQKLTVCG